MFRGQAEFRERDSNRGKGWEKKKILLAFEWKGWRKKKTCHAGTKIYLIELEFNVSAPGLVKIKGGGSRLKVGAAGRGPCGTTNGRGWK